MWLGWARAEVCVRFGRRTEAGSVCCGDVFAELLVQRRVMMVGWKRLHSFVWKGKR